MADLQTTIDPGAIEPGQNNFDPLPPAWYPAQIIESEVVAAKTGNGLLLNLTWEIVEGDYQNRKFWQRINYQHTSAQAQMIGQQQLKAICDAIGYAGHLSDSEVLHFQPMQVRLGFDKPSEGYEKKNEVKAVKSMVAATPASKTTPAPAGATAPTPRTAATAPRTAATTKPAGPPAAGARPWAKPAA